MNVTVEDEIRKYKHLSDAELVGMRDRIYQQAQETLREADTYRVIARHLELAGDAIHRVALARFGEDADR